MARNSKDNLPQLQTRAAKWLEGLIGEKLSSSIQLSGGMNNQLYRVECGSKSYVIKHYFRDDRERFRREVEFIELLTKNNIKGIPKIVHKCETINCVAFAHISGIFPTTINQKAVEVAAKFIGSINQPQVIREAQNLLPAFGSLNNLQDFISDVDSRVERLRLLEKSTNEHKALALFINEEIIPHWNKWKSDLKDASDFNETFVKAISPSDFGFHNVLVDDDYIFLDFEYAGWDSAEKLVSDFFGQPRFSVDACLLPDFIQLAFPETNTEKLIQRCTKLIPISQLKWSLIFLNEFINNEKSRRQFSQSEEYIDLDEQLLKSKNKFYSAKKYWEGL